MIPPQTALSVLPYFVNTVRCFLNGERSSVPRQGLLPTYTLIEHTLGLIRRDTVFYCNIPNSPSALTRMHPCSNPRVL